MKKYIEKNKKRIMMTWGIGLILVGIIGLSTFIMGGFQKGKSEKIHLLCIGIDKYVPMNERVEGSNSIGQADGIFLVAIDKKEKNAQIVSIPRDTMVTIEKYYSNLEYIGQEEAQICLQYAYADGLEKSCELMVDRVEEIFDEIEIDGYISINMSAVLELNDLVGGVTVTVDDATAAAALGVEVGSSVTLASDGVPYYLQPRNKREPQSAYGRTLRYKNYITSFVSQGLNTVKENPELIKSVFDILKEDIVTDLQVSDVVNLSMHLSGMSMEDVQYHTLEGKIILGEDGYEEFYPSKLKLNELYEYIY